MILLSLVPQQVGCHRWLLGVLEQRGTKVFFIFIFNLIVKLRNIWPGTSSNGWRDHRRKQKLEQGKKFLTFSVHYLICDCRTEQPKARKSQAAPSAGLGNSSNSRKTTTRAIGTKTLSKLNGNVRLLMDPQPSASSYLPPVYWVSLPKIPLIGIWRDQIWIWSSNLNRNLHKKVIWNFIANQRWGNQSSIVAMYDCKAIIKGYLRVLNQLISQYKSRLVSIFLRFLVYQNTALLSYFRPSVTGMTSELFL